MNGQGSNRIYNLRQYNQNQDIYGFQIQDHNNSNMLNKAKAFAEEFIINLESDIGECPSQTYLLQRRMINLKNNYSPFQIKDKRMVCSTCIYKNKYLFLGTSSNILSCYNLETNELIYEGKHHIDWVISIQVLCVNGIDLLVSGGGLQDQSICFYDLRNIQVNNTISLIDQRVVHKKSITKIIYLQDKNILITCSSDFQMKMWKLSIEDTQQKIDLQQIENLSIKQEDDLKQEIFEQIPQYDNQQQQNLDGQQKSNSQEKNESSLNQQQEEIEESKVQQKHEEIQNQSQEIQNESQDNIQKDKENINQHNEDQSLCKEENLNEEIQEEDYSQNKDEEYEDENESENEDEDENEDEFEEIEGSYEEFDDNERYYEQKDSSKLKLRLNLLNCIPETGQIYSVCESDDNFIVYGTGDGHIKVIKIRQIRSFFVQKSVWCLQRFENFKYIVGYSFQIQGYINIINIITGQKIMSFFKENECIHSFHIISKLHDKRILINNEEDFVKQSKNSIALVAASKLGMIKVVNIGEKIKSPIKYSYTFNQSLDWIPWNPFSIVKQQKDKQNIDYERYRIYCSTGNSQIQNSELIQLIKFDLSI